ncbi:MAG TPA: hypothetical protein VHO94_03760 [Oscillospiraceae bacterium]|nr:hypothetical protein [Oscillospiraceae bacterium]
MSRFLKISALFLICFVTALSLFGCSRKNAEAAENRPTTSPAHSIISFISVENRIYKNELSEVFDPALLADKISNIPYRGEIASCYKIKDVSTDKSVAIRDEYGTSKYKYLCDESFVWNKKSYKISYDKNNVGSEDNNHFGKNLGKLGNLEVCENTKDSSGNSLFVHPNELHDDINEDEYFLATEITNNTSTSKK